MSKKDDKFTENFAWFIIIGIILLPVILVYFAIKWIGEIIIGIQKLTGNKKDKTVSYNLKICENDDEELDKINNMSEKEFIKYTIAMLIKDKFIKNAYTFSETEDFGADIIGEHDGEKYAFICIKSNSKVDSESIGEILRGMNYYKCKKGVIITNNYFTDKAYIVAEASNVELWNVDDFMQISRKVLHDFKAENKIN